MAEVYEKAQEHGHFEPMKGANGNMDGGALGRQMTMQLSNDQYERLFFQPSAPKGDLAKRLGNPTLLGLLGFLIPYTSTMLILWGARGAVPPTSLIGLSGDYYFLGGIAMVIAGLAEFVLGNSKSNPYPPMIRYLCVCRFYAELRDKC